MGTHNLSWLWSCVFRKNSHPTDIRQTLYTFVLHTYSLRTMIPHSDGIHVRNGPLTTEKTLFVTCIMATVGWRRSRIPSLENFATHSHKSGPPLVGEEAGFPLSRILCTATQNPQHWRSSNMPGWHSCQDENWNKQLLIGHIPFDDAWFAAFSGKVIVIMLVVFPCSQLVNLHAMMKIARKIIKILTLRFLVSLGPIWTSDAGFGLKQWLLHFLKRSLW